ncbi:MAG TPA: biopolymer transporter ExbD [Gemmatimonadales bacterium]
MAGGGGGARGEVSSEPNVIPMIDIMLVLLIIFMISQPLSRQVIEAQVPPPETAVASTAPSTQIVLELTADGGYAINSQVVPRDQLDTQIHAIYDNRPAKLLFLKSAPDRIYQEVIEAMDIARGAGVQVIGFTPKV